MRTIVTDLLSDKSGRWVVVILLGIIMTGLLSGVIASERPSALIPFGPQTAKGTMTSYKAPGFQETMPDGRVVTHLLGTDQIGRDVAARLIHGINTALIVGITSTLISLIIALLLGVMSGYFGNHLLSVDVWALVISFIVGTILIYYIREYSYGYDNNMVLRFQMGRCFTWMTLLIVSLIIFLRSTRHMTGKSISIPLDSIVLRLLEIFKSIPTLFLLLAIYALITNPSVWVVVLIIGMLRWGSMARLVRAEVLRAKQDNYIKNAQILGISHIAIIYKHLLPNVVGPLMVAVSFSIGTAILIESTLSFLQIGLPISEVSWGQMLSQSRNYFNAWWLAVPPGLMIFLIIFLFNHLGDRIEAISKLKKR